MSFRDFTTCVKGFLEKAGDDAACIFHYDMEKQRYIAVLSDRRWITGRPSSRALTVNFGSGHQAMVVV